MMIEFIVGIGIVCFLFLYFSSSLDKEHVLLKMLISFIVFGMIILIPMVMTNNKDTCEIVKANETIAGNTTTYEYQNYCVTNTNTTHTILFKTTTWFLGIYALYITLYFMYVVFLKTKLIDWGLIKEKKK